MAALSGLSSAGGGAALGAGAALAGAALAGAGLAGSAALVGAATDFVLAAGFSGSLANATRDPALGFDSATRADRTAALRGAAATAGTVPRAAGAAGTGASDSSDVILIPSDVAVSLGALGCFSSRADAELGCSRTGDDTGALASWIAPPLLGNADASSRERGVPQPGVPTNLRSSARYGSVCSTGMRTPLEHSTSPGASAKYVNAPRSVTTPSRAGGASRRRRRRGPSGARARRGRPRRPCGRRARPPTPG